MSLWCTVLSALLAAHAISGMPSLAKRSIETEAPEDAILYGYVIDLKSPNYLTKGDQIFVKNNFTAISAKSEMYMTYEYSDSEHTAAENIAASLKVAGRFGAFSGAASMEFSKSTSKSVKTVRVDAVTKAVVYEVRARGWFNTKPGDYLTEYFIDAAKTLPMEQLEEDIGIFYATALDLGGETRKSYTMKALREDSEVSVKATLKASYGTSLMGGSVSASAGYGKTTGRNQRDVKIEWVAQGGKTSVWLAASPSQDGNVTSTQQKWADSFTDGNLYPANLELKPVWDLVGYVDKDRGAQYKAYLEAKWGLQAENFKPSEFAKLSAEICYLKDIDFYGADIGHIFDVPSIECCKKRCEKTAGCKAMLYRPSDGTCWRKNRENGDRTSTVVGLVAANMSCFKDKE